MRRPVALIAGLAGVLALSACAGQFTDDEVRAANGITRTQPVAAPGTTAIDTGAPADQPVAAADPVAPVVPGAPAITQAPGVGKPTAAKPGKKATDSAAPAGKPATTTTVSTPGQTGPIVLGSVGNYSGPAGAAQAGIPRGVQTWAAATNATGGLFGRKLQVIVVDDGGDPARYASAVRDLVENRGAIAFVGNGASLSMKGGISYLNSKGVPVIGTDCSVPQWFDNPGFFPQCPAFETQVVNVIRAGVEVSGKKRFGYLTCREANACTSQLPLLTADNVRSVGADLVYSATISLTQVDFTAECRNAQEAKVDLFYVAADPNTLARVARSCSRQGYTPQYTQLSITTSVDTATVPGLGNLIVSNTAFPFQGATSPAIDEYTKDFATYVGARPGAAEGLGWAAAKLFQKIATNAALAEHQLSAATLMKAARQINGENLGGLTTKLDFTKGSANPANCYFVVQIKNAAWSAPKGPAAQCVKTGAAAPAAGVTAPQHDLAIGLSTPGRVSRRRRSAPPGRPRT
ncbi:MAG TPA: ABC transporter substrate-binding protein [Sporichthyaceae bacterium]|nr:ABC transporter substrate-binding protein [Sporichthyaceae bacterium]